MYSLELDVVFDSWSIHRQPSSGFLVSKHQTYVQCRNYVAFAIVEVVSGHFRSDHFLHKWKSDSSPFWINIDGFVNVTRGSPVAAQDS